MTEGELKKRIHEAINSEPLDWQCQFYCEKVEKQIMKILDKVETQFHTALIETKYGMYDEEFVDKVLPLILKWFGGAEK